MNFFTGFLVLILYARGGPWRVVRWLKYWHARRVFARHNPPRPVPAHDCGSSHVPRDTACTTFLAGANGRCVYCDHDAHCHPGPGATCWVFHP